MVSKPWSWFSIMGQLPLYFGFTVLFNLYERHPTGCRWWTSIICRWYLSGFPTWGYKYKRGTSKSRFSTLVDWFVDDNPSVHFGEDKIKSILFFLKYSPKTIGQIDISYKDVKIKQYSKVTYLGCVLDKCLKGESMAMQVYIKVFSKLMFLYRHFRKT